MTESIFSLVDRSRGFNYGKYSTYSKIHNEFIGTIVGTIVSCQFDPNKAKNFVRIVYDLEIMALLWKRFEKFP